MAQESHGSTPAAWTAVLVMLVGVAVASVAVATYNWPLFWIGGGGLVLLGVVAGWVLKLMGYGNTPRGTAVQTKESTP